MGLDSERTLEVSALILVASLAGARALFVATHLEQFHAPLGGLRDAVDPFARGGIAGLSVQGGAVAATVASLAWLRARGLPVLRYADLLAPSVALGEGIARLGCAFSGCCYGIPTVLPWGIASAPGSPAALRFGAALLHPAQLYASIAAFGAFGSLVLLSNRSRRSGVVFFAWLALTGGARAALDPLRAHDSPSTAASSSLVAAAIAASGMLGLIFLASRARKIS